MVLAKNTKVEARVYANVTGKKGIQFQGSKSNKKVSQGGEIANTKRCIRELATAS